MFRQIFTPKNSIELKSIPEQMNFSYSFKSFHLLSLLFGFFPFTIVRNQSDIIIGCSVGVFDIVLLVLNIALQMTTAFLAAPIISFNDSKLIPFMNATTPLSVIGNNILGLIQSIIATTATVFNLLHRNQFIEIFKAFDAFDKEVNIFLIFGSNALKI